MSLSLDLSGISWLNLKQKKRKKENAKTSEIRHVNQHDDGG